MNRRDALARIAVLMGGAVIGAGPFLRGAPVEGKTRGPGFSNEEVALLDEIGDTIIPTTDTPGAKAVNIGAFMVMMVNDCYDDQHHAIFKEGLGQLDAACKNKFGRSFVECTPAERIAFLNEVDREQRTHGGKKSQAGPAHYFSMMKQLTLLGYFTSEIGCTKALRYVETPGGFNGDVPYKKGDKAWFSAPSHSV
jgi:hypothetical protein